MRRLFIALNCLVLAVASVVLVPAFVLADTPSSYTSYGYAAGVHAIGGSDAFPNFQNGAVNNRYPMAENLDHELGGNICRCGAYVGVRKATLDAARKLS